MGWCIPPFMYAAWRYRQQATEIKIKNFSSLVDPCSRRGSTRSPCRLGPSQAGDGWWGLIGQIIGTYLGHLHGEFSDVLKAWRIIDLIRRHLKLYILISTPLQNTQSAEFPSYLLVVRTTRSNTRSHWHGGSMLTACLTLPPNDCPPSSD